MGLFGLGRGRPQVLIHGARLKVRSGRAALPAPMTGAFVVGYALGETPLDAVRASVRAVQAMGYEFEDVLPDGLSIPMEDWGRHVAQAWPDVAAALPTQAEIAGRLADGGVVLGPFIGFETTAG